MALSACDANQPIAMNKDAEVAVVYGSQVHMLPRLDPNRTSSAVSNAAGAQLAYYGGHVISNVKVVAVFWGPNIDPQITGGIGNFYSSVTNSAYMDWLSEYDTNITAVGGQAGTNQHIGRGTFAGAYTISPSVTSGTIDDTAIQTEINKQISNGVLPAPDSNTLYMTYFPKGLKITQGGSTSCVEFCAYHGTFTRNGASTYYGVLPDMSTGSGCDGGCGGDTVFNNTTSVSSHEMIEAVTDGEVGLATTNGPPLAWYNSSQGEIGDMCNAQQASIAGYVVQKQYDNATSSCIVSKGTTTTNDFSVAVTPATASVAQGASVTYQVSTSVTSGAAQSITLSVAGLPTGVTGSFSPASVTAGGMSTLTISASATAAAGATNFTVKGAATSGSHTANASVTVTTSGGGGGSCINGTFSAVALPMSIPDNNTTGITSLLPVTGNGTVSSLSISLGITHTYIGDLVVTLYAPDGSSTVISNRAGGSTHNLTISNKAITAFSGKTAAGTWKLKVQDLAAVDTGTLDSWSLNIVGNCGTGGGGGGGGGAWTASGSPNMATIDNSTACTTLNVTGTGNASDAKVDLSGRHDYRSILKGTLTHNGQTGTVFNTGTFPAGAGTFSLTGQAVAGFTGSATGTWQLCITDTDAYGDTGTLNTWSVHN
ncbi:MAG TPA: proprotein convertase P-domain-containing protein [bacterium]|nr:proprotein convertase P-domain-containing protein [bacterium]